jgi:hypothetical protein
VWLLLQMKEASGDAKSELNKQVQVEVKALKGLKEATAAAQETYASTRSPCVYSYLMCGVPLM